MSRAKSFVIHGNYFYEIVLMVHASTHLNKLELELTTSKDIMAKELTEKRFYVYIFYISKRGLDLTLIGISVKASYTFETWSIKPEVWFAIV